MPGTPEHKCDFNHKISNLLLESRKRRKKQTKKKKSTEENTERSETKYWHNAGKTRQKPTKAWPGTAVLEEKTNTEETTLSKKLDKEKRK